MNLVRSWLQCATVVLFLLPHAAVTVESGNAGKPGTGEISNIIIKDDGIVELVKGEVAIIFYITVSNIGHEPVHLMLECKKCCQKFLTNEEDCVSMKPLGGDMGDLFPQDTRNLTMIYPTMYAHDRVGSCEVEIISKSDGKKLERTLKFNTTLPRGVNIRVPRLLEQYYDPDDLTKCENQDEDPLNLCQPVDCVNKYVCSRNFYNSSSRKCEELPECISETKEFPDRAYLSETNKCLLLKDELSDEDKDQFQEGKPGVHELTHHHRYPMNLVCHQGTMDEEKTRCTCKRGWASAPFDPATFNFDVQVYHMCTIWTGELSAKEAQNITHVPKEAHARTNIILFSSIAVAFVIVAIILSILLFLKQRKSHTTSLSDGEGESLITTDSPEELE